MPKKISDLEFINANSRYLLGDEDFSTPTGIRLAAQYIRFRMIQDKQSLKKFKDLPIGTIFQTHDGRASEGFTWVGLVKVSDTECSRLVVSPIKMRAVEGPLPSLTTYQLECPVRSIVTADMRLDPTQFAPPTKVKRGRK